MKNPFIIIGLSALFFGTMASPALAETVPTVQPNNGFLEQPKAIFMDAPPVPVSLHPTLLQQVRAANLLAHEEDTLPIGSPEYKHAHRLLVSNLRMLERQLFFNPVDLARFNATTHPARSTIDPSIYPRGNADGTAVNSLPGTIVVTGNTLSNHTYVGNIPTRRSIIATAEAQNGLRVIAMTQ